MIPRQAFKSPMSNTSIVIVRVPVFLQKNSSHTAFTFQPLTTGNRNLLGKMYEIRRNDTLYYVGRCKDELG